VLRKFAPLFAAGVVGCASPPAGFESPVPAARLEAITHAAQTRDEGSIPDLIAMLDSDDPVVRLAAIRTLERITGTTLGYDYAAPAWQRRDAVKAWADWYKVDGPDRPGTTPVSRSPGPQNADSQPESPPGP
jgi:hypothetical protein